MARAEIMPYNEEIDARIRKIVSRWKKPEAKKMFGGVCYLLNGNMVCGVYKDYLILRLGEKAAAQALKQILAWQVPEIATTLAALTEEISQRAAALGLNVAPAQLRAGHLLGIRFPEGVPEALIDRLARNRIFVSVRGNSIRISPHLYNTAEDIDKLFSVLG